MTFLFITMFFITFSGLSFHRTHLLSALLCLEGMMLTIYISISLWPNELSINPLILPLILLSMSACEAGLGLSLMVATARTHGNDNLTSMYLLKC